jgi:hypothetical protein
MRIDKLIPISPDAQFGALMTTYNDRDSIICRPRELSFNVATRTTRDQLFYEALTMARPHKDNKKIEDEEVTAAKAYIGDLLTYLQDQQARHNLNMLAPRRLANWASGEGHNIWSVYELNTELATVESSGLKSFPAVETFIKELNPIWTVQDPYEINNLPKSSFVAWGPSLKVTEADTLRKSLADNADLFENICGKLGVKCTNLSMNSFLSSAVPNIKPFDYDDYRWLFWAFTGMFIMTTEDDGSKSRNYSQNAGSNLEVIDAEGDETWLTDGAFYYMIPRDGQPSALNAVIKMIIGKYLANDNPLGCAQEGNDDTLDCVITGNDKSELCRIANNDVSGGDAHKTWEMVTHTSISSKLFNVAPGIFVDNETYACEKVFDGDANAWVITNKHLFGGLRALTFSSNVWTTNYNKERSFFVNLFQGKGSAKVSAGSQKSNAKKFERRAKLAEKEE